MAPIARADRQSALPLKAQGTRKRGGARDKAKLLEDLGADFQRLLDGVSISRSRRQIEQFYADEMEQIGQFPARETPVNRYPQTTCCRRRGAR